MFWELFALDLANSTEDSNAQVFEVPAKSPHKIKAGLFQKGDLIRNG